MAISREEMVLAALAASPGHQHTPVQVQKLLFLIQKKLPETISAPGFDFQPFHYGPFDKSVYEVLERLAVNGQVLISTDGRFRLYSLTTAGQEAGVTLLSSLDLKIQEHIGRLSHLVRKLSFSSLVSFIYQQFPEMRENSVFHG